MSLVGCSFEKFLSRLKGRAHVNTSYIDSHHLPYGIAPNTGEHAPL